MEINQLQSENAPNNNKEIELDFLEMVKRQFGIIEMQTLQINIPTLARGRQFRNRPLGIEAAGTPLQKLAQKLIHRDRARLGGLNGAVSFGRSVAAFLPGIGSDSLGDLVIRFRRVLVMGLSDDVQAAVDATRSTGAEISGKMPIIGADDTEFLAAAKSILANFETNSSGRVSILNGDASASDLRDIQDLQMAVGLTPLPGAFLRGGHGRVSTVAYHDFEGRLLASATTVDLAEAGPDFMDTAILVGVSVHPDRQGLGLGKAITAAALIEARNMLGARRVVAVVSPTNEIALNTNAKFGLHPVAEQTAVYLELSGQA